jgi:hypothetical protein
MHSTLSARRLAGIALAASIAATAPAQAAPVFNLNFIGGTSTQAQNAFTQAAAIWSNALADSVTVNLTVGTATLGSGILASAGSTEVIYSYAAVRAALVADSTSANDAIAVTHLQAGPSLKLRINATSNNPNGSGSFTPYIDNNGAANTSLLTDPVGLNNNVINMTRANAKALGLGSTGLLATSTDANCSGSCDGYIAFNNAFSFDYDPSNGIASGLFDFVGIAIHEIGHALGFISGVDVLDINSPGARGPFLDDDFTFVAPLDLYRCTAASAALGALDWTVGNPGTARMFSLNACQTSLATFSQGRIRGDGQQASHWKDNLGLGIMDPTAGTGEPLTITTLDLIAMDVIGWNLPNQVPPVAPPVATPAPASALVFALGLAGLGFTRRPTLARRTLARRTLA